MSDLLFDENDFAEEINENKIFNNVILTKKNIAFKYFFNCRFISCIFSESMFRKLRFEKCIFTECDLSLVKLNQSSLMDVEFEESKLVGINWTQLSNPALFVNFYKCIINYSVFLGKNLRKVRITECIAKEVDFSEADLTDAKCNLTDFSGSRFMNTDLTRTDFSGAMNYSINPKFNKLKKTVFSLPEAVSLLNGFDIILK